MPTMKMAMMMWATLRLFHSSNNQKQKKKNTQNNTNTNNNNTSKPNNNQASGDTGRRMLMMGDSMRLRKSKRPTMKPSGIPTAAAAPKPMPTRYSELRMFQPMPWSLGPLS